MTPEISYSDEFNAAWQKERSFLIDLGLEIDCAILFGSLATKMPRVLDREEERSDISKIPEGRLASDADIIVFSDNLEHVMKKLKEYFLTDPDGIYETEHELYSIAYFGKYDRNLPSESQDYNFEEFSRRIPKAEIYLFDANNFSQTFSDLIETCSVEKDEVYARCGFTNQPQRSGIYGTERLFKMKRGTIFIQAIKTGKLIEGQIPKQVHMAVEVAEKALNEFHARCAPRRNEVHPDTIMMY